MSTSSRKAASPTATRASPSSWVASAKILEMSSCLDIIAPEDRELAAQNLLRRLNGEALQPYVLRLQRRDGGHVEAEIYASLTTYHSEAAVLGTVVDITQRRQAERALSEREELYRTVVGALQEGVILFDADGQIITANERPAAPAHHRR